VTTVTSPSHNQTLNIAGVILVALQQRQSGLLGNVAHRINNVNRCWAQLVLEWVTISVCNQPFRPTQPGHPSEGRHNQYWQKTKLRHTAWCTCPTSVVLKWKQVSGWGLKLMISSTAWALWLRKGRRLNVQYQQNHFTFWL